MTTTSQTDNYDTIMAFYKAQEKQTFAHNREILLVALQARGVAKVSVTYCGSGDSGAVEDCTIEPGDAALTGNVTGRIPSFADWARAIRPERWMGAASELSRLADDPVLTGIASPSNNLISQGGL